MPKLINADKLRKDVLDLPNCYNGFSDTYDKAMILDLVDEQPTVLSEVDLIEIEDRFGYFVRAIIEDMISGENNRWSTKWCEETLDIKKKMSEMECRTCEHLVDQFGNYVMCKLLRRFVDYEYWNGKCPDDCPLERERKEDGTETD